MARQLVLVCLLAAAPVASAQEGPLGARELYNAGRVDEAIEQAEAAWVATASAEAGLVLARAKLDRFSRLESGSDLSVARQLLDRIDVTTLLPAQRLDWEVGVATGLFLAGRGGPSGVMFERLLDHPLLEGAERDRVLNWWATAVDRVGRDQLPDQRSGTYDKMARRLERRGVNRDGLTRQPAGLDESLLHPRKDGPVRLQIDQAPRARNRRMIGWRLVHGQPQKAADRQRVRRAPRNPAFRVDAFEGADQPQAEVAPGCQARGVAERPGAKLGRPITGA